MAVLRGFLGRVVKSGEADEHQVALVVLGVAQAARGQHRRGDREQAQAVLGVRAGHVLGLRDAGRR